MPLTEPQTVAVIHALLPLEPVQRTLALLDLLLFLDERPSVGDGELYRELVQLQRMHFAYPCDQTTAEVPYRGDKDHHRPCDRNGRLLAGVKNLTPG
jgi:hypothetical protein